MADIANKYAENVSGKFYCDDQCIDCDLCRGQCCKFVVEAKICVDDRQFSSTPRTDRE